MNLSSKALEKYHIQGTLRLFHISENTIYVIENKGEKIAVLRICRKGYHTKQELKSEIIWLDAVKKDTELIVPEIIPGKNGEKLQETDGYYCIMWKYIKGIELKEYESYTLKDLKKYFYEMGRICAKLHIQAEKMPYIPRTDWNYENCIGKNSIWGDWRNYPLLKKEDIHILNIACEKIKNDTSNIYKSSKNYGLIHTDVRLSNLLDCVGNMAVLDFDDCGYGFHLQDLAGSLSFMETKKEAPFLIDSWLEGYSTIKLPENTEYIPYFILARRLQLLGWLSTHKSADTAEFNNNVIGTVELAKKFMNKF